MTMTQRRPGVAVTANPRKGMRVQRPITRALRRTEAGRIALPLSVTNDGEYLGLAELVMTYDETAELHAQLGRMLAEPQGPTPDGADA